MAAERNEQVVQGLAKIGMALRAHAWKQGGQNELTPTQAEILALLRARADGLRLGEVADALAVSAPTASDAVAALVRKGFIRKVRAAEDGRAVVMRLTASGRRKAAETAQWTDFLLAAVDALSPGEQAVFHRALIKMIRTLQVRGEIPVARMCVTCRYFQPHVHDDGAAPHHCGYVDAPFGEGQLRVDCADHDAADTTLAEAHWRSFLQLEAKPSGDQP